LDHKTVIESVKKTTTTHPPSLPPSLPPSPGISAEVINLRTLRPLDHKTVIESVKKTSRMVTVEEGWPQCGKEGEREGGREGGSGGGL